MPSKLIFLDKKQYQFPRLSKNANFALSLLFFLILALGYIFFIHNYRSDRDFVTLLYLFYITVLLGIIIYQFVIHKKFGRRFIHITDDSLIIKIKYRENSRSISWDAIEKITFSQTEFVIKSKNEESEEIKFKAPLETYLEIRDALNIFGEKHGIAIDG